MANSGKTNPLLDRKGQPAAGARVAMRSDAYTSLMSAARKRMPEETVGALVGHVYRTRHGQEWIAVEEIAPLELVPAASGPWAMGLTVSTEAWEQLKARPDDAAGSASRIVGWFYADPGIGLFRPRLDVAEAQRTLTANVQVFLLVNPATDQGAFFVSREGGLTPTGGFYEVLPAEDAPPAIPWNGEVQAASEWLGDALLPAETPPAARQVETAGTPEAQERPTQTTPTAPKPAPEVPPDIPDIQSAPPPPASLPVAQTPRPPSAPPPAVRAATPPPEASPPQPGVAPPPPPGPGPALSALTTTPPPEAHIPPSSPPPTLSASAAPTSHAPEQAETAAGAQVASTHEEEYARPTVDPVATAIGGAQSTQPAQTLGAEEDPVPTATPPAAPVNWEMAAQARPAVRTATLDVTGPARGRGTHLPGAKRRQAVGARHASPWLPAVAFVLWQVLGLALCGLGVWQGRAILSSLGKLGATPAPSYPSITIAPGEGKLILPGRQLEGGHVALDGRLRLRPAVEIYDPAGKYGSAMAPVITHESITTKSRKSTAQGSIFGFWLFWKAPPVWGRVGEGT